MAFNLKDFSNLYPTDENFIGDSINLFFSESVVQGKPTWSVLGAAIPTRGINGDLTQIVENASKIKFRYRSIDADPFPILLYGPLSDGDKCISSPPTIPIGFSSNNYIEYLSTKIFDSVLSLFDGNNFWYRGVYYEMDYPGDLKAFRIDDNGNIVEWHDCATGNTFSTYIERDFYTGVIEERRKRADFYFVSFENPIDLSLNVNGLPGTASIVDYVFFEPQVNERIYTSDFNVLLNNNEDSRRSSIVLTVDRVEDQVFPTNFTFISNSINNLSTFKSLPKQTFANLQDSNYETLSWVKPRYEGTESKIDSPNQFPVAFNFTPFEGSTYDPRVTTSSVVSEEAKESIISKNLFIGNLQQGTYSGGSNSVKVSINPGATSEITGITGSFFSSGDVVQSNAPFTIKVPYSLRIFNSLTGTSTENRELTILSGTPSASFEFINNIQDFDDRYGAYYETTRFNNLTKQSSGSVIFLLEGAIPANNLTALEGSTYIFEESDTRRNDFSPVVNSAVFDKRTRDLYYTDSAGVVYNIQRNLPR